MSPYGPQRSRQRSSEHRMQKQFEQADRYLAVATALNEALSWHLSPDNVLAYAEALRQYAPAESDDAALQRVATNYHRDHHAVQSLLQAGHFGTADAWEAWMVKVVPILRSANLNWSGDVAVDADDLAQNARAALAEALPHFRYGSRLSTWTYGVVVQSAKRFVRDQNRLKRVVRPESLDRLNLLDPALPPEEQPDVIVAARELAAQIDAVLAATGDERLVAIFRLWAQDDWRAEDIGRRGGLSAGRVRTLIESICRTLQQSPAIQAWLDEPRGRHDAGEI